MRREGLTADGHAGSIADDLPNRLLLGHAGLSLDLLDSSLNLRGKGVLVLVGVNALVLKRTKGVRISQKRIDEASVRRGSPACT